MAAPEDVIEFINSELDWLYQGISASGERRAPEGPEDGGWHGLETVDSWSEFRLPEEVHQAVYHVDEAAEELPQITSDYLVLTASATIDGQQVVEDRLALLQSGMFFETADPKCLALRAVTTRPWGDQRHLWIYLREEFAPSEEQYLVLEERYRRMFDE